MTDNTTVCYAWAIKAPDGGFVVNTHNDTEEKAWGTICPGLREIAKERGYRCVRVRVGEIENTSTSRKE